MAPDSTAVFVASAVAVLGAIGWLGLVVAGFLAYAKARNPSPRIEGTALPTGSLAIAAAAVSLGSAFLGPFVVVGQIVALILAGLALREANAPTRTLARWVIRWASVLLVIVLAVGGITLAAYLRAAG